MSAIDELGRQRVLPVLRCADADDTLAAELTRFLRQKDAERDDEPPREQ